MNSPVGALGWEIWRRNRYGFALLLAFLLVCLSLSWVATHTAAEAAQLAAQLSADAPEVMEANARAMEWRGYAFVWGGMLFALSLLVTLAAFACAESSPRRGFSGIPPRLFTKPVPTRQLVAVPIVSGAAFVAVLYLLWSWLVFTPLLGADERMPNDYFLVLLPALLAAFQALIWTLPGFPKTRATLLTLLITTAAVLGTLPVTEPNQWLERKPALMTIYAAVLAGAPFVAWLGVRQNRKGEWREWPALTALMSGLSNLFLRRHEFASPGAAQFWIETRRNGRLALGGLLVVILFFLGLNTILVAIDNVSGDVSTFCRPIAIFLVFIWTPVLGLMVCSDVASRRLPLTTFQGVRPVAVGQLVAAKLRAIVAVWLAGWLLALLSMIVWAIRCGLAEPGILQFHSGLDDEMDWILRLGVLSLHAAVGLFPLWLTGRVPGLPWSFVGLLIVYAALGHLIAWFDRHSNYWHLAFLLIGFAAATKLGVAFLGFRRALKRNLVNRTFVFGTVSIWVIGTAVFMALMSDTAERRDWNQTVMLPFAALLFPVARVALAPLAMAMNRHR